MFYVYIYRDPSRGNEPFYVGKGFNKRAYVHLKRTDRHPFTYRLAKMKRNGIEPHIEIIRCNNEEVAFAAEVLSIRVLGRKDLGLGPLVNMTDGGEGTSGYRHTEETRQNMSDAQKGENNSFYGKSHSNEHCKKISNAQKGKSHSVESRQKMSDAQKGENNHNFGKSLSVETCQKLSAANKGKVQPKSICPHCGKLSGPSRFHFDKCKMKKEA